LAGKIFTPSFDRKIPAIGKTSLKFIARYNSLINFRAISLATLRHVSDSYHSITPVLVDICPPPLISTEKSKVLLEKARHESFNFNSSLLLYMEEKRHFFVEYSGNDIRKLAKKTTKYEPES